jgi:hypothetical protein
MTYEKVEPGDHCSITTKAGDTITGEVLDVTKEGITVRYEVFRWPVEYLPEVTTIPWKNQKRRYKLS